MKEKQDLEDDAQACRRKMANATALIDGLGGEKVGFLLIHPSTQPPSIRHSSCVFPGLVVVQVRWTDSSAGFQTQIKHLVGDVLLSAGFLSYAGPFNQEYRSLLLEQWKKEMEEKLIPFSSVRHSSEFNVRDYAFSWSDSEHLLIDFCHISFNIYINIFVLNKHRLNIS